MPNANNDRRRAGTAAMFAASAVLATLGIILLVSGPGDSGSRPAQTQPSRRASVTPSGVSKQGVSSPATTNSPPTPNSTLPAIGPTLLPQPVAEPAERFTIAWASHDARPGGDSSYNDAALRAATYATGGLATDLRARHPGTAADHQWTQWQAAHARVVATVTCVSVPDGAPTPTASTAYARVLYRVITTPQNGQATTTDDQIALILHRSANGSWRVVALPNA